MSDISGLTRAEVEARVARGQANRVSSKTSRSIGEIIRANIFTLFNGIIFAAMLLVLITGDWKDAVFGVVIIINTAIGVATEVKSKLALDKLSILIAAQHTVRRDGADVQVSHDEIVLDDVLWVKSGEQVPADGIVLEDYGVELDESMLTGESRTVTKKPGDTVYSGATVVSGSALVRVSAVGEDSYAAKLTAEAKVFTKTRSDINEGINKILRFMIVIVVPLCALLIWSQMRLAGGFSVALASGAWRQAVVQAVAGIVGLIPEGLVLLTSLNFALAALRLSRKNTLVQELDAVETLARVDALNLDKTGTLTDGGIALDDVVVLGDGRAGGRADAEVKRALWHVTNEETPNPTATAVQEGLAQEGLAREGLAREGVSASTTFAGVQVLTRVPFSSARKWSSVVLRAEQSDSGEARVTRWYFGAPEIVTSALDEDSTRVLELVQERAATGARVLVLASVDMSVDVTDAGSVSEEETPHIDPRARVRALIVCSESVREDAEKTLAWFREQGVRARVISGDNPRTVAAIAHKVKLTGDSAPRFLDARELPDTPEEVAKVLENVDVVGRVLPNQKKLIVQALHTQGHTVAMTGDGVNDALALKEADLGIAMGNAAPATKAVAQVVLVDSLFSHLPDVVARGRQVMANMERVASLFLVKTTYSVVISLGVVLLGLNFPYLPRHMTYIGWFTIGTPAFLLALAPNTRRYIPGFLRRVIHVAVPAGLATGLSVLASTLAVPALMGWGDVSAHLTELRTINVTVLFVLGIVMLASIARPLRSWRGWLVAFFACAGVAGAFIPFVAQFFQLHIPSGSSAWVTLGVSVVSVLVWLVIRMVVDRFWPQEEAR
ncbi:HAD-IC family P-type ATPase [Alloscardovia macacae]|uniref:Haloacid dehalogenase n=1 Tax=Alloscardovia macacae TaxID=1160091 RepID=A0A261F584_9BIFI|nr:HAD-IC family P-type ATPase [Alloscardovia macacae]OZG54309.1 haloacid dehalogenase [Alloscardovia macacae]